MSLDRMRRNFHTGEFPVAGNECLDAELVAALAEGSLDPATRARALRHVAGCAWCRRAVASVAGALADGPVTHEIAVVEGRAEPWWKRRTIRLAVPLAVAATVLVLLGPPRSAISPHRGGPSQSVGPTPIGPLGTVASADRLQWRGVLGADRYRATVFAADGHVLYETEVADTIATVPDSVHFTAGQPYLWKVEGRTGRDRWATSELVQFTIARAPPE